jgi:hypothetical protein
VKRHLLNVAAVVSLGLCVALVALAVRSYWVEEYLLFHAGRTQLHIVSYGADLGVLLYGRGSSSYTISYTRHPAIRSMFSPWRMTHFGFSYETWPKLPRVPFMIDMMFPNWALAIPLGWFAWWSRRKTRQPPRGFCMEATKELSETSS